MSFNRGGNGQDSRFGWGDDRYAYSQTMSFSMSFPFFNQGSREEQIVRSRVAEDNAEAQLRDARLLAQQQLTQYMSAFRSAEQRVQIQLASVEAAEEDLRVQQRRYSLGASTFLDVLNSQVTLNQARRRVDSGAFRRARRQGADRNADWQGHVTWQRVRAQHTVRLHPKDSLTSLSRLR